MANNIPDFLEWAAAQQQLDPALVDKVIKTESAGNQAAVSPKGARGLMQLMPGTAKELGVNADDPVENVIGGLTYMGKQRQRFGNERDMLAAYNAGPGRVASGRPLPAETTNYVNKIEGGAPPDFLTWAAQQQQAPAAKPEEPKGYFETLVNNIPKSAGDLVEGMAHTVLHPIDTAKAVIEHPGEIVKGLANRVIHPLDTLRDDPVGAAFDIAGLVAPAARMAGFGKVAAAADLANPLMGPAKVAQSVGTSIYTKALKPTQTLLKDAGMSARELGEFGLKEGANISERGAAKVAGKAERVIGGRNATIGLADAAGQTANPMEIVQNVVPNLAQKMGEDITPEAKLAALQDVKDEFIRKYLVPPATGEEGPANLRRPGLLELEKTKERAYEYTPKSAWMSDAVPPATRDARMGLASEIKRQIEDKTAGYEPAGALPVKQANARYAQLKNLQDAIEHRLDQPSSHMGDMLRMVIGHAAGVPDWLSILGPWLVSRPETARALYAAPTAARVAAPAVALSRALNDR